MMSVDLNGLKKYSILFAEDEKIAGDKTNEILNIFFDKVFYAHDGSEALEIYKKELPDLALLDIKMPYLTGLEVAEEIRKTDYYTPIIFMSSYSEQKYLMNALNLSSNGYVIKPLDFERLMDLISKSLSRIKKNEAKFTLSNTIEYDTLSKELFSDGKKVELGIKEQILLNIMIKNTGRTISKEEISETIYPLVSISDSAIKNLIGRLREKIGTDKIDYVKGAGWKLNVN